MSMLILVKLITTIASFVAILFSTQLFLWWFDWCIGLKFKDVVSKVLENSNSTALYFGLRWLGATFAMSMVVLLAFIL